MLPNVPDDPREICERGRRRKTINVEEFSLNGNPIGLETNRLARIGAQVFVLTKKCGQVKVTSDANAKVTLG